MVSQGGGASRPKRSDKSEAAGRIGGTEMIANSTVRVAATLLFAILPLWPQARDKRIAPFDSAARQSFERQPKVAVLAGVGHYTSRSGLGELHYPARDVQTLETELKRQGYSVVSLPDQEATRGSVVRALKDASE